MFSTTASLIFWKNQNMSILLSEESVNYVANSWKRCLHVWPQFYDLPDNNVWNWKIMSFRCKMSTPLISYIYKQRVWKISNLSKKIIHSLMLIYRIFKIWADESHGPATTCPSSSWLYPANHSCWMSYTAFKKLKFLEFLDLMYSFSHLRMRDQRIGS
jgi:hypothetical protein